MTAVLGFDIGGANLKAAHSNGAALTVPFALWKSPDRLGTQLGELRGKMPQHNRLAITMTGELCDCFAYRREGVLAILRGVEEAAAATPIRLWTTLGKLLTPAEVRENPLAAAAANWLALAHLACRFVGEESALLIDTGSTTTDIVYLEGGQPRPRALTDRDRLASGELVYTGIRRTPVCAVLGMGVAAEWFATMLDVYLVLGLIPENTADTDTADGRPATRAHAHARLARLWCADAEDLLPQEVESLARRALRQQLEHVGRAVGQVLAGRPLPTCVILSGSGEVLSRMLRADHAVLSAVPTLSLADRLGPSLSEAACAYAVARMAIDAWDREA
jgi:probable H4MPT-linked C1 transfer pathway protein